MKHTATIIVAIAISSASVPAADPGNLFPEGDFESPVRLEAPSPSPTTEDPLNTEEGLLYIEPGDYKAKGCEVSIEGEGDSSFLRLKAPHGFEGILRTYIPLRLPDPTPATITISQRWRLADYEAVPGAPEWASAQNDPIFVLADGTTKIIHGTLRLRADTAGEWQEVEKSVNVPEGAKILMLQPGLFMATGTLEVDDIKVFAE